MCEMCVCLHTWLVNNSTEVVIIQMALVQAVISKYFDRNIHAVLNPQWNSNGLLCVMALSQDGTMRCGWIASCSFLLQYLILAQYLFLDQQSSRQERQVEYRPVSNVYFDAGSHQAIE